MYHGNLAATVAWRWAASSAKLVWGVRQSLYDLDREKPMTRWVIRALVPLSRFPRAIVYNSHMARSQHETFGFQAKRGCVIDNGFDFDVFRPDPDARTIVRNILGLVPETPLIGLIARYHPMKGHLTFLEAAARLAQERADVHFLLVGRDVGPDNPMLSAALRHPALAGRTHCLGERDNIPLLTAALDVACSSSSWGEAFPNALGEAMACGVPVVATDIGDVRRIVGDAGIIVPVADPGALCAAWKRLLDDVVLRSGMGRAGRLRLSQYFTLGNLGASYAALYEKLTKRGTR